LASLGRARRGFGIAGWIAGEGPGCMAWGALRTLGVRRSTDLRNRCPGGRPESPWAADMADDGIGLGIPGNGPQRTGFAPVV